MCDCVRAVSPPAAQWWLVALRGRDRRHGQGSLWTSRAVHFHMLGHRLPQACDEAPGPYWTLGRVET